MICCIPPMPSPRPTLSICIPTWNRSAQLQAQLIGLLPHISDAIEIVIVDNGSNDDTLQVIRLFCTGHPQVRLSLWSNEVNLGADINYLRALECGRGEWLWLLGDDEDIDPSKMDLFLRGLSQSADLAIIHLKEWAIPHRGGVININRETFLDSQNDILGYAIHKIGLFALRREAALSLLRRAYTEGLGYLHSYSFITLGLINEGRQISLISAPGFFLIPDPQSQVVRWNALEGEYGAWQASELALADRRRQVRAREARLRLHNINLLLLRHLASTGTVSRRYAWWAVRMAPITDKPIGLAILGLAIMPRWLSRRITRRFGTEPAASPIATDSY